ncbi:MAG: GAF domain-containing protein, partial [Actinomycetota bacterium]|nr:GAF domain-containing protein [Actinomycetota bacterium]
MSVQPDRPAIRTSDPEVLAGEAVARVSIDETVARVFEGGDTTLEETLCRLAVLANETISGSDMVAVTTLLPRRRRAAGFSDARAAEVDGLQRQSDIGPCDDAVRRQRIMRFDSAEKDYRWPAFNRAAAAKGILASLSIPLVVHHQGYGALHCYSRTAGAFSADDERTASAFATAVAVALVSWDARHRTEHFGWPCHPRARSDRNAAVAEVNRLERLLFDEDGHIRGHTSPEHASSLLETINEVRCQLGWLSLDMDHHH